MAPPPGDKKLEGSKTAISPIGFLNQKSDLRLDIKKKENQMGPHREHFIAPATGDKKSEGQKREKIGGGGWYPVAGY